MVKKAFSLIELLVTIVIISILLGVSLYWAPRYIQARKIEGETHKIYQLLKRYQVKAKVEKIKKVEVDLSPDGKSLIFSLYFNSGSKNETYPLQVPFELSGNIRINQFGIFPPPQGNIHYKNQPLPNVSFDCVKVAQIRVCEGKWNGTDCLCKY